MLHFFHTKNNKEVTLPSQIKPLKNLLFTPHGTQFITIIKFPTQIFVPIKLKRFTI